jgi:hypothetical protein
VERLDNLHLPFLSFYSEERAIVHRNTPKYLDFRISTLIQHSISLDMLNPTIDQLQPEMCGIKHLPLEYHLGMFIWME